ncbi:MAG: hypothetical protein ACJ8AD_04075, partial [Gemmatimonadaceae bacterium]
MSNTCSGVIAGTCAWAAGTTTSVTLAVGASQDFTITFTGSSVGSGSVDFAAANSSNVTYGSATTTVTVDVPPATPSKVPVTAAPSSQTLKINQGGSVSFHLTNQNVRDLTVSYTVSCSGTIVGGSCSPASGSTFLVGGGGTADIPVSFTAAGSPGTGYVTLAVSGGGTATATVDVQVPQATVTAVTGVLDVASGQPSSTPFTVSNAGGVPASMNFSASCTGSGVLTTPCSMSAASATLAAGASTTVTVSFQAANAGGGGTVTLFATNAEAPQNQFSSAARSVNVPPPPPRVALSAPATQLTGQAGQSTTTPFTLRNTGYVPASVSLNPSCSGAGIQATPCAASPTSATLQAGDSLTVNVSFQFVNVGGSGTISLKALNSNTAAPMDSASRSVTAPPPPPVVAVSSTQTDTLTITAGMAGSTVFKVKNTGYVTAPVTYSPSCTGSGLRTSPCQVSGTPSASLLPNDSVFVTVTFQTSGAAALGNVNLSVTNTSTGASLGSATRTIRTSVPPLLAMDVPSFHGGTTIERSLCLNFSIVSDVASECGALRITHALPGVTTYGKSRVPVLGYNSEHVYSLSVPVHVSQPAGSLVPDSIQVNVYSLDAAGTRLLQRSRTYGGSTIPVQRLTVQPIVANANAINRYTVELRRLFGTTWQDTTTVMTGEIAKVDRRDSPFGAGWWLDGLEQLFLAQWDGSVLWIGGDGSTRKYVKKTTTS